MSSPRAPSSAAVVDEKTTVRGDSRLRAARSARRAAAASTMSLTG